jgi:diguanylate cyclase
MKIEGNFLSSAFARKIFLGVFLFTLVILLAAGTVFYAVADHLSRQAAGQVLTESAKAFSRNFFDRLTAAEVLLRTLATANATSSESGVIALNDQQARVFATVTFSANSSGAEVANRRTALEVQSSGAEGLPELALVLVTLDGARVIRAALQPDYLWESANSAIYRLCVATTEGESRCLAASNELMDDPVKVSRTMLFEPFFDARPWTINLTAYAELTRLLPFHLGLFALAVGLLALLVAMIGTSIYLRRMTSAFDGLIRVTRRAGAGDFAQRVPLDSMKDELSELGRAFNTMMAGLQSNFAFQKVLSDIDAAILDRKPLDEMMGMVLAHAHTVLPDTKIQLVRRSESRQTVAVLRSDGSLQMHVEARNSEVPSHVVEVNIGSIEGQDAAFLIEESGLTRSSVEANAMGLLQDLGKRLAIAAEARRQENILSQQATTDSLTGLLNRFGFTDSLRSLIREHAWSGRIDVVFCDLDNFKEINDAYGHAIGDEVLTALAGRFKLALAHTPHHAARLGGDEFGFLFPSATIDTAIAALRAELSIPVALGGREALLTASIGSAAYPQHGANPEELLRKSDLAMYRVKGAGGNAFLRFDDSMDADAAERLDLLQYLRSALVTQALHVVYQPRVSAGAHRLVSVEALMRWHHPEKGAISPARFIPIAEASGLIVGFGDWILQRACEQFLAWELQGLGVRQISVNVSPIQLAAPDFHERFATVLKRYELPPGSIELEITEGALVQNMDVASQKLRALQAAGFHIALDDFGVGYSALSYLSRIPFDTLKIDQSFVSQIHTSHVSFAIATAIVALAKALGKRVVAEGVEEEEQCTLLEKIGADELQGYWISRPKPAAEVELFSAPPRALHPQT